MDLVRLRYVGAARVRVPKLNRVVEPDELVGVPKDVFDRYAWPESDWQRQDQEQTPPADEPAQTTTTTSRKATRDA